MTVITLNTPGCGRDRLDAAYSNLIKRLDAAAATPPPLFEVDFLPSGAGRERELAKPARFVLAHDAMHHQLNWSRLDRIGGIASDAPEPKARKPRSPLVFRERDVRRAISGHLKAGLSVARTEIDITGKIVIVTGQDEPVSVAPVDEWETL